MQIDSLVLIKPRNQSRKRLFKLTTFQVKTLVKPTADDIPGELKAHQESSKADGQSNDTISNSYIEWKPPLNPNTMIVRYNVRITKVDENFNVINCITAKEFEDNHYKYYMKLPGTYNVEVQAVPLNAEPGQWTKPVKVRNRLGHGGGDEGSFRPSRSVYNIPNILM